MHMLHMWHIYANTSPRYAHQILGIYVSGRYMAITGEVEVAVGCVLVCICKMLGMYANLACWLCKLY